ncbi:MAG: hypothetical protein LKK13_03680 [Bacilli bacterium]|jgi:putative aldouronate transport system substrate-binding protein|nr:hypothetical protein [Bacilli bacterium]
MKNPLKRIVLPLFAALVASLALVSCGGGGEDEYDDAGNLKISLRNLYFESWTGNDIYTDEIEGKFKVDITPSSYSYNDWSSQVSAAVNANNLTDVFQYNLTQFNCANSYRYWADAQVIKALPDDLSPWPNVEAMLSATSDIDAFKIDGKLYGIPIAKNISDYGVDYSPFTYVYRRDWAKKWNVYQEGDVYSWEQFQNLLDVFNSHLNPTGKGDKYALADVEWSFPSVTNFYKDSPHCFSWDATARKYVGTFATDAYVKGMDLAKSYVDDLVYGYDQYTATEGGARKAYCSNDCGVLYENLSLSNYEAVRKSLATSNALDSSFSVDDASAIMKVKGPDGKYALEGAENWYSMTFFNYDISEKKQKLILDIMDYLLGAEGTKLAVYGLKGYDYTEDGAGNIALTENGWPKDDTGAYVEKENGAKYLRYMVTLGNDYDSYDPLTDREAYGALSGWQSEMDAAEASGLLRVFKEKSEVMWLSTDLKDKYEGSMLEDANDEVVKYCYGKEDKAAYLDNVTKSPWPSVLSEINGELGYGK